MNLKKQFEFELNPLLLEAEKAIVAGDRAEAALFAIDIMTLASSYRDRLSDKDIRDVLNNPKATEIAKRLGVQL